MAQLGADSLDGFRHQRLGPTGGRLAWLVDDGDRVSRDQPADDGAAEDALEQHQRLSLRLDADFLCVELRTQVLDEHRRDRTQLVVAERRQSMGAPDLEVAALRRGLEVRDCVPRPPFLADELRQRHPRLNHPGRERAELLAALDVGLERGRIAVLMNVRCSWRPPSRQRTTYRLPRF